MGRWMKRQGRKFGTTHGYQPHSDGAVLRDSNAMSDEEVVKVLEELAEGMAEDVGTDCHFDHAIDGERCGSGSEGWNSGHEDGASEVTGADSLSGGLM